MSCARGWRHCWVSLCIGACDRAPCRRWLWGEIADGAGALLCIAGPADGAPVKIVLSREEEFFLGKPRSAG